MKMNHLVSVLSQKVNIVFFKMTQFSEKSFTTCVKEYLDVLKKKKTEKYLTINDIWPN